MKPRSLSRRSLSLGVVAMVAAAAAACGSQQPDATPTPSEDIEGGAEAVVLEKPSIEIALTGIGTINNAPLYIAEELGYFEDHGLEVNLTELRGGSDAIQALVTGTVDVTTNEFSHTLNLQLQGKDVESVATIATAPTYALVLTEGNFDKTVSDLADMQIGVVSLGGATEDLINYVFTTNGLDPAAASLIAIGVGQSQSTAVRARQVDALIATEPTLTTSLEAGEIEPLLDFRRPEVVEEIFGGISPFWSVIVMSEFAAENPNTTAALAKAVADALDYMSSHTAAEIVDLLPADSYYPDGDKEQLTKILEGGLDAFSTDGLMPDGGAENIARFLVATDPELELSDFELQKTYSNEFIKQ